MYRTLYQDYPGKTSCPIQSPVFNMITDLLPVPVLHGRHVIHFLEHSVKVLDVLIPDRVRDAFYRRAAAFEHGSCFFHADFL